MRGNGPLIQIANASALAAAGAYTVFSQICEDTDALSLIVSYTQGAAGGAPVVRIGWTFLGGGNTITVPATALGVINSGGTTFIGEEWTLSNLPAGVSPFTRVLHLIVPPAAQTLELGLAEIGVVGTPGTVSAWLGSSAG